MLFHKIRGRISNINYSHGPVDFDGLVNQGTYKAAAYIAEHGGNLTLYSKTLSG